MDDEVGDEQWAAEILQSALQEETGRRTRIIDRAHAALIVYAALAATLLSRLEIESLDSLSFAAALVFLLMGALVLWFWWQIAKGQGARAVDPEVFDAFDGEADRLESVRDVRQHLQQVVLAAQNDNTRLGQERGKLQEAILVALLAGATLILVQLATRTDAAAKSSATITKPSEH